MSEKVGLKVKDALLKQNSLIIVLVIFPIIVITVMVLTIQDSWRSIWPAFLMFGIWIIILISIFLPVYLKSLHYCKANKDLPDVLITYDHEFNTVSLFSPQGTIRIRPSKIVNAFCRSSIGKGKYSYGEIKIEYLDNQKQKQVYKTMVMDPLTTAHRLNEIKKIKYEDEFDIHF